VWQGYQRGTALSCCQMAQSQAVAAPSCLASLPAAPQVRPRPAVDPSTIFHQCYGRGNGLPASFTMTLYPHLRCCHNAFQFVSVLSSATIDQIIHREDVPNARLVTSDVVLCQATAHHQPG
jgi:hypothetical protein